MADLIASGYPEGATATAARPVARMRPQYSWLLPRRCTQLEVSHRVNR
jgi:hypothetical protein